MAAGAGSLGAMEEEGTLGASEIDEIEIAVKDGQANKYTKAKLIRFCKAKKILTTGTKK